MEIPKKIYKYESFKNEYSLPNLRNNNIYLSDPSNFNDPFDSNIPYSIIEMNKEEMEQLVKNHKIGTREDIIGKEEIIKNITSKYTKKIIDSIKNTKFGVCCFSGKNDDILMWSHYSHNHTGFCLEFSTTIFPFNLIQKVNYEKNALVINLNKHFISGTPDEQLYELLLTKYISWEYEEEWRLLHKDLDMVKEYELEGLESIYIGCNAKQEDISLIKEIVKSKEKKINLYQMEKSLSEFKVTPVLLQI